MTQSARGQEVREAHSAREQQIFNPGANCKKLPPSSQSAKEDVLRYTHTHLFPTKRAHKADNDKESASILLSLCGASAALPLSKHPAVWAALIMEQAILAAALQTPWLKYVWECFVLCDALPAQEQTATAFTTTRAALLAVSIFDAAFVLNSCHQKRSSSNTRHFKDDAMQSLLILHYFAFLLKFHFFCYRWVNIDKKTSSKQQRIDWNSNCKLWNLIFVLLLNF